jgi:hypothetical protein
MTRRELRTMTSAFAVALLLTVTPRADAATRYVTNTGSDGPSCGLALTSACRSISQAVELANPGDTILVGPGRYGDLNRNGILGEPGEELGYLTPPASCSCVLLVHKRVILISSAGAAVTMIDGRSVDVIQNVLLSTGGGEFGRPGKGFTVTGTAQKTASGSLLGEGIVIDEAVTVRGNQVVVTEPAAGNGAIGIAVVNGAPIRIEGNLVTGGWSTGIQGRAGTTVSKNQALSNILGIKADGGSVVGNVAAANGFGIYVTGTASVTGNAAYSNGYGFIFERPFSGVFARNNMFGNRCGLQNGLGIVIIGVAGLVATNNYWGAATGPGSGGAADNVCDENGGTSNVTPFATKPFTVKPLKP